MAVAHTAGMGPAATLGDRVAQRSATVGVVGLGYVGLPTAVAFAAAGFRVIAHDTNTAKVQALAAGRSPIPELGLDQEVADHARQGRLTATADPAALAGADIVLLIVPTPVDDAKQPDLSYVRAAARTAAANLRPGQLVILESTTYPGTTRDIVLGALQAGAPGLVAGRDYGVGYCPERYNPGDPDHTLATVTRVVSGLTPEWTAVCAALYGTLNGGRIHAAPDLETAEAAKVIENIQRDLNIALVNELALIFERIGLDAQEVLAAAATKWNFLRFNPGPGVGGHCLPVDPYYLTWLAERAGYHPRVILAGRAVNDGMPLHVVELAADALNDVGLPLRGTPVAVLGLAYKAQTGDARESPAEGVVRELRRRGADVRLCDPFVPASDATRHFGGPTVPVADAVRGARAVLLLTDHTDFRRLDAPWFARHAHPGAAIVDTRAMLDPHAVAGAGLRYRGVGRRPRP